MARLELFKLTLKSLILIYLKLYLLAWLLKLVAGCTCSLTGATTFTIKTLSIVALYVVLCCHLIWVSLMPSVVMLNAVMLHVVMLNVVAPLNLLGVHSPNFFYDQFYKRGGWFFHEVCFVCFRFKVLQPFYGVFCKHPPPFSHSKSFKLSKFC